ncbi:MAG TPA: HNH endonuclease signature motif containing protein [Polyangia bacterium]|nr:HNH endonuclease signature motif containing protein [Polyangia bacterium]
MPKPPRTHMEAERRREALIEAGYRCAIPACGQTQIEVHHIDGDRTNHAFENLIVLCRNDHYRAERGDIDKKAVRIYKSNLGLISGRYSDMERRLLTFFVDNPSVNQFDFDRQMEFDFLYLLQDGLLVKAGEEIHMSSGNFVQGFFTYGLTPSGEDFVRRLARGQSIASQDDASR